jgi:hypothetical protein
MSRNVIFATGAVLWAIDVIDAAVHIAGGDWVAPGLAAIVGVTWIALRWPRRSLAEAT